MTGRKKIALHSWKAGSQYNVEENEKKKNTFDA